MIVSGKEVLLIWLCCLRDVFCLLSRSTFFGLYIHLRVLRLSCLELDGSLPCPNTMIHIREQLCQLKISQPPSLSMSIEEIRPAP